MLDMIKNLFSNEKPSKNVAKERLQLVLVHDRSDCSPELINKIKNDIFQTLTKYIDIDEGEFDIAINNTTDHGRQQSTLVANIPITKLERVR